MSTINEPPVPATSGIAVHLIFETADGGVSGTEPVVVPSEGVFDLQFDDRAGGRLVPAEAAEATGVVVERVGVDRLLLVNLGAALLYRNDQLAPRIVMTKAGDQVRIGAEPAVEVALFNEPEVGPPSAEQRGKPCPVCRVPVSETSRIYRCPCGVGMHLEEGDPEQALQCAQVSGSCPSCRRPVHLTSGYLEQPEFLKQP